MQTKARLQECYEPLMSPVTPQCLISEFLHPQARFPVTYPSSPGLWWACQTEGLIAKHISYGEFGGNQGGEIPRRQLSPSLHTDWVITSPLQQLPAPATHQQRHLHGLHLRAIPISPNTLRDLELTLCHSRFQKAVLEVTTPGRAPLLHTEHSQEAPDTHKCYRRLASGEPGR